MFGHIFINRLKIVLRQKGMIFWTLLFPIIMATFFSLALSNIVDSYNFKVIDIAIVDNEFFKQNTNFKNMIDSISKEDKNQIFNVEYTNLESANQLLEDNKISGYIKVLDEIDIVVKSSGVEESVIKSVIDNYYQTVSLVNHIVEYNPDSIKNGVLDNLENNKNYFKSIDNNTIDILVIYFYSLIGMTCLYGGCFGINAINETEANLSKRGARLNISPSHKLKVLLCYLLVALIIHYSEILILMFYITKILNINFGNQLGYILLLEFFGSLAGITLGTFIGSFSKKNEDTKTGILISITMFFSFLSGMMIWQIKYIVREKLPMLANINPVNMITDGLYALYYYDTYNRYIFNLLSLIVFSSFMIVLTYVFIRRKNYDSI